MTAIIAQVKAHIPKPRLPKYKREAMTEEQLLEHKRQLMREAQKRHRAKTTATQKRTRRIEETTRCYDWAVLLPHIRKEDSGCWVWTGSYKRVYTETRPYVHRGTLGRARADIVVWCLHHKQPLPHRCTVTTSCGRLECVAPDHLLVTNRAVERAKRRIGGVP